MVQPKWPDLSYVTSNEFNITSVHEKLFTTTFSRNNGNDYCQ